MICKTYQLYYDSIERNITMNVYDFDNTIYDGESIIDFFNFLVKKDFKLVKYYPKILRLLILYKMNKVNIEKLNDKLSKLSKNFFKNKTYDLDKLSDEFWNKNINKLKPDFINQLSKDDIIITGCPNFLIERIQDKLKVKDIISTQFNMETKEIEFLCFSRNKVIAYNQFYRDKKIDKFYTDSLSDKPLMSLADEVYYVTKKGTVLIDKEKI